MNIEKAPTLSLLALPGALLALPVFPQSPTPANVPPDSAFQEPTRLPEVRVSAPREVATAPATPVPEGAPLDVRRVDTSPAATTAAADSAVLLSQTPGAAVVRNGPQTGLVQLRGLSGDRVKVSVAGMTITPACPNHMDPPLHYAAPTSVEALMVMAGLTPVSLGGDSLGGTVLVQPRPPRFATDPHTLGYGQVGGFYRSSNDGYGFQGEGGVANRTLSAAYQGSWQTADDLRFPGGRVSDTGFDTQHHGVLTGLQTVQGVWALDAGMVSTRDAGTPALPMDMIEDDAYRLGLQYKGAYGGGSFEGRAYFHTIDHLMDNYSLRPVPAGVLRLFSPATSEDYGTELRWSFTREAHTFRVGTGFHANAFDAYQQNALTAARQDTLNEASRIRVGTYGEWQADWTDRWATLVGLRNDNVLSDAANVTQFFGPSAADATRFNSQAHDALDVNFDALASLRFTPNAWSAYELGFARKNRAPSLLERYLWTPLSASAGQADGRTYLGNLELDSETSHQMAVTADFRGRKWQLQATPFYSIVTDYIQGTPGTRLDAAGRPVLRYTNLDWAELYGVDGTARYAFTESLTLRGHCSYVRGINRDDDDHLYRIAPLRGAVGLEYQLGGWESALEVVLVADQNEVAAYNGEPPTPGYALLNLRTGYTFRNRLGLQVGFENLTDERYADHLGGINRVGGGDVAINQRLPSAGRLVTIQATYRF